MRRREGVCSKSTTSPNDCGAQFVVARVVSFEPVHINTYAQENMTFAINEYFSVAITDALNQSRRGLDRFYHNVHHRYKERISKRRV
jgi:hypothetical protein